MAYRTCAVLMRAWPKVPLCDVCAHGVSPSVGRKKGQWGADWEVVCHVVRAEQGTARDEARRTLDSEAARGHVAV